MRERMKGRFLVTASTLRSLSEAYLARPCSWRRSAYSLAGGEKRFWRGDKKRTGTCRNEAGPVS